MIVATVATTKSLLPTVSPAFFVLIFYLIFKVYLGCDKDTGKEVAIKCVKTKGQKLTVIKKVGQFVDS